MTSVRLVRQQGKEGGTEMSSLALLGFKIGGAIAIAVIWGLVKGIFNV